MTGIIISMASAAVVVAVSEEICSAVGKIEYAKWVKAGGISLVAVTGIGLVAKLMHQAASLFK